MRQIPVIALLAVIELSSIPLGFAQPKNLLQITLICNDLLKSHPEMATLFKNDPKLRSDSLQLAMKVMGDLQAGKSERQILRDPLVQQSLLEIGGRLQEQAAIGPLLILASSELSKKQTIPPGMIAQLERVIHGELIARGATIEGKGNVYESWMAIYRRIGPEIRQHVQNLKQHLKPGTSLFENSEFRHWLEKQTHTRFHPGAQIEILVDGPESFSRRVEAIRNAARSIDVLTWAFYDDAVAEQIEAALVQAHERGVRIRVIVDGQIALDPSHSAVIDRLAAKNISVLKWTSPDPARPFSGQHRKGMLIDGNYFIGGGRNFGKIYQEWRDTDVEIKGPVLDDFSNIFNALWNHETPRLSSPSGSTLASQKWTSLVDHHPGSGENILRSNLIAIEAASETIRIENAYFILDPATYAALLRAKARGVRIQVFTNSPTSVDEPIVSLPILRSVNRMVKEGFEVYLKDGTTLHSKFLTIDRSYSSIGSYNFHPRSYRYEGEMIFNIVDSQTNDRFTKIFENDISQAIRVLAPIPVPKNVNSDIGEILFYDQL